MNAFDGHVLITGSTGFIGRHVAAIGRRIGSNIYTITHSQIDSEESTWVADLQDFNRIKEILSECRPEAILHLAAAGVKHHSAGPAELLKVNTIGLANLFRAIEDLKLRPRIVLAGSGYEYKVQSRPITETDPLEPSNFYGVSKASASLLASLYSSKMPIVLLRLFSVYGPGEGNYRLAPYVIRQAKANAPVELTGGAQLRDFTYVGDVAEAFWRALLLAKDQSLTVVNVSAGVPITLRQFVDELALILRSRGIVPDLRFGAIPYREDEPMYYLADTSRMQEMFRWSPPTSLSEGILRTVEAFL